jgi:hypothetical protein
VVGQRMTISFAIEHHDRLVDGIVEAFWTRESLVSEMMPLQIAPELFDVVELRRQNRLSHCKRALGLDRSRPRGNGSPQCVDPTLAESAASEPHGILAHAEGLGDPRARPACQGQQERPRPIRLASIPRVAEDNEVTPLRGARDNRGFARHNPHPEPNQEMESQTASVGHPAETCLGGARAG